MDFFEEWIFCRDGIKYNFFNISIYSKYIFCTL